MTTLARTSRGLETNASHAEERIARGTWRAAKGYDEVDAQTLAISKLSRQKWVMQNIKSLAFREDDDEIYDGIETIRRVYPERVFDSESGE